MNELSKREMRTVFCETLMNMAENDQKVIVLDADLMLAMGTIPFREKYPERTFDCGVQEANMIGVAAGLSATGFIPFAHTFAPFASRRACDQIFMSCAYAKQNVKIVGSDPGITAALNGGTHMPFEDLGIMSTIPEIIVVEPCDEISLERVLQLAKETYGTWYIRLRRRQAPIIYGTGAKFEVGKSCMLKDGTDVTIIAMGYMVDKALEAADILEKQGIHARVIDMWCLKPIDENAIIKAAEETGAIVTAENHNIRNGLGSAVASVLALKYPVPLEMTGVQDEFGEVGQEAYLEERFGLTSENIVHKVNMVLKRK